jgi:hypothetical protein
MVPELTEVLIWEGNGKPVDVVAGGAEADTAV